MRLSTLLKFTLAAAAALMPVAGFAIAGDERHLEVMTPQELIARALRYNLELESQRLEVDIREAQVNATEGEFDPAFIIDAGYNRSNRAQNQREFLSTGQVGRIYDEEIRRMTVGVGGRLPYGTHYEMTTGVQRINNTSNQQETALFNPEYQSTTQISVTQPLLKNFGRESNLASLRILEAEIRSEKARTQSAVEQLIGEVLGACFELQFAEENIRVKQQSIELAERLMRENQRRVEEGRMSPIDVTQAEVRVAEAREELISARNFYADRQNTLQKLTGIEFDFEAPYVAVEGIEGISLEQALNHRELASVMMQQSPIYASAVEMVEAEDVRIAYAKNQSYPQVDLQMSIGWNGLNDYVSGSYTDYKNRSHSDWGVGISVNVPIGNRTGRARITEANRRKAQALLGVKQTEVQLLSALDSAVRDVRSGLERLELIQQSVNLAESALVSEERRLATGMTTSYNVLNQQRELSMARTRALAAEVDVQQAWAQLLLIQGGLARELGYELRFSE